MTAALLPLTSALALDDDTAHLDRAWWSWAGPHGGLLAALALRSASSVAGQGRRPRTLTAQFLSVLEPGLVPVRSQLVREGGSSSTVSTQLLGSDGRPAVTAVLTSGRSRSAGAAYVGVEAPPVLRLSQCQEVVLPAEMVPFAANLAFFPASPATPLGGGQVAELLAWVRLRSGEPLDTAALTVLVDAMPPALYAATVVPLAVPTVELTGSYASDVDEDPSPGWVLIRMATRGAADGWCVDDSEVWDEGGRLLAQARQTRRVLGELVLGSPGTGQTDASQPESGR